MPCSRVEITPRPAPRCRTSPGDASQRRAPAGSVQACLTESCAAARGRLRSQSALCSAASGGAPGLPCVRGTRGSSLWPRPWVTSARAAAQRRRRQPLSSWSQHSYRCDQGAPGRVVTQGGHWERAKGSNGEWGHPLGLCSARSDLKRHLGFAWSAWSARKPFEKLNVKR